MATHSSILAWRIPRTEEAGGLQSMALQSVGHDWATNTFKLHNYYFHTTLKFIKNVRACRELKKQGKPMFI